MPNTVFVHGLKVAFEENARPGIDYLSNDLDTNEARIFFDQARVKGSAQFEDDEDRQYTLFYQKDGSFVLARR